MVVETLRDGEPYPQENGGTCEFDLPTAVVKTPDGVVATYEVKLDSDRNPQHIDWITKEQDILRGLYDLQKDTLTTCSPPIFNGSRPEELETRPGDGRWVFRMRRQTNP